MKAHRARLPEASVRPARAQIDECLTALPGRECRDEAISKAFSLLNFAQIMTFANALAKIARRADHHREPVVRFGTCRFSDGAHSIGRVAGNGFACAEQIEALCAS